MEETTARIYSHEWFQTMCQTLGEPACKALGLFEIPDDFVLSVVIPVYNEEKTLAEIVAQVAQVPIRKEILLIDDYSRDDTRQTMGEIQKAYENDEMNTVQLFFHEVNQGKGAALRTGFQHVTGNVVIIQDAELEYDPTNIEADCVHSRRKSRRGLRQPIHPERRSSRCVLLAHHGKQISDVSFELLYKPASDGHGNVLQSLSPRVSHGDSSSA